MYKQVINRWKLRALSSMPFSRHIIRLFTGNKMSSGSRELFNNILFKNSIGLGPGVDRDGQFFSVLSDFGFSFITLGPVNSSNVKTIINRLQSKKADSVISLCINKDHCRTFSLSYDFADMFSFDIPDDDIIDTLNSILDIRLTYDQYKPILLRITHDLPQSELDNILSYCQLNGVDGIVTAGKASVSYVRSVVGNRLPIIGYGGIKTPESAKEFIDSGADLIEITDGLMKTGPSIASRIYKHLNRV